MDKVKIPYSVGYIIRGIAMLMIIFIHSINEYSEYNSTWCRILMIPEYGCMGCSIFFFMSGYGLFSSFAKKTINFSYLISHLHKLLLPFIATFFITYLVVELLPSSITQITTNDITAIFKLSMPCGIDMWFFKIILANYCVTILLFLYKPYTTQVIEIITILHVSFIIICYLTHRPLYWYCSNLAFPLGAMVSSIKRSQFQKVMMPASILSIILFCIYYLSNVFGFNKVPITITGNLALCILLLSCISIFSLHIKVPWLEYIGKNSLYYYLFNVFVMLSIPSQSMSYLTYFTANVLITTMFVWMWKKYLEKQIHLI